MIDEKSLQERLTALAAQQDDLLPRALDDDLAAGRRRLRRRNVLAGGGAIGAVAAVTVLGVGVAGWMSPSAGPTVEVPPVAGQSTAVNTEEPGSDAPGPGTTGDVPVPADQGPPVPAADATFNRNLTAAMYAHLDPGKVHLDFGSGGFTVDRQPGARSGGNRIGWRMPGQMGAEGYVALSVQPATRTPRPCGSTSEPRLTCHSVTLPNGRTAQLGRQGDAAAVLYRQPDGEYISVTVSTLFGNNTEIPVHDLGITDQQLLALVQDNRLNLPSPTDDEQAKENAMKGFKPSTQAVRQAAGRALKGGTVTYTSAESVPEQLSVLLKWTKGSLMETVEAGVDSSATVSPCKDQIGITCQQVTLPDGRKVMYGEGLGQFPGGRRYVRGVTFLQPDGDSSFARVLFPGKVAQPGGITKAQLITLATDTTLDK